MLVPLLIECPNPVDGENWLVKGKRIGIHENLDLLSAPAFLESRESLIFRLLSESSGEQQIKRNTIPDFMNFLIMIFYNSFPILLNN